jgi:Tol biopolymer transport system component
MTPEIFAPGIVSRGYHEGRIAIAPSGKEMFYHFGGQGLMVILYMKEEIDGWSAPQVAPFSGIYRDGEPQLSSDGKKLFFRSTRPISGTGDPMEYTDNWVVRRSEAGWEEPENLGFPLNSEKNDLYPFLSRSGDLYFASDRDGGWDIYVSRDENGEHAKPQKLGDAINSEYGDWDACLSPDESYILFGSNGRPEGYGESDLYISFREEDGTWSKSRNMGSPINTVHREVDPVVSPDGKYIFFRSNRRTHEAQSHMRRNYDEVRKILDGPGNGEADIFWVDAEVIERLRPEESQ